jgi:YrbI family 3-deoxy-D-manno-octulosonate 8-phosphate phosphatase
MFQNIKISSQLHEKALKVKILFTDCDGVLTDNGVYYSSEGEVMKRFSIRDGMGVERLKNLCNVDTGIITGELSGSVKKRAEKLKIEHLYLGIKDKKSKLKEIMESTGLSAENIAYIGDDVNDLEIMELCGLTATPADGLSFVKEKVDFICSVKGGYGAFREFAELIIYLQQNEIKK